MRSPTCVSAFMVQPHLAVLGFSQRLLVACVGGGIYALPSGTGLLGQTGLRERGDPR